MENFYQLRPSHYVCSFQEDKVSSALTLRYFCAHAQILNLIKSE